MLLARVIGTVVATRKETTLEGVKFLLLQATEPDGTRRDSFVVAADAVSKLCLIGNLNLITKIYFPREVVPLSSLLSALFDFSISSAPDAREYCGSCESRRLT